jgi:hypothetical protein
MPVLGTYRDPIAMAATPILEKTPGRHLALDQSGVSKHIGCRTRAVITPVVKPRVASAPFVGHSLNAVRCCNRPLHCKRGPQGRTRPAIDKSSSG